MRRLQIVALVALAALGACASNEEPTVAESPVVSATASAPAGSPSAAGATAVKTAQTEKFGTILVDSAGKSLYTFDKDSGSTSACTDACASTWPPLVSDSASGPDDVKADLGVITRPDGTKQVTYKGKPLYRYSADTKAGDVNGDGVGGNWHVAKVA